MSTKLSFLSRAAAVAGIVAISGLPALAQGTQPAPTANVPAPSAQTTAPVANQSSGKVEDKANKGKARSAKKHQKLVKTAKSDTGHKPAPAKAAEPATTNTSK